MGGQKDRGFSSVDSGLVIPPVSFPSKKREDGRGKMEER